MTIHVQVVFAAASQQYVQTLELDDTATVADAVRQSAISQVTDGLPITDQNVGIFARPVTLMRILKDGDRVEIYRPLTRDPKDRRRLRAREQKISADANRRKAD